jgi:hypothetical protein
VYSELNHHVIADTEGEGELTKAATQSRIHSPGLETRPNVFMVLGGGEA